jgi:transposase
MKTVLHVGMDVHKDTIEVAVLEGGQRAPMIEQRLVNDEASVRRFFEKLKGSGAAILAGYEACTMGFHLYRQLDRQAVGCVVIAPSKIARAPGDRVKTDRRDARTLAKLLQHGDAEVVGVPDAADEAVRDYLRARDDVKVDLRRYRQRLNHLLLRHGYLYTQGTNWTMRYRRWLAGLQFHEVALAETVMVYRGRIGELEDRLKEMDEKIEQTAKSERYRERVGKLRCLRGIEHLSALALVVEIGDYRRFESAGQFMAFLGSVPSEHSSGSKRRQGAITKTGNGHLRRLLVEAAWHYRTNRPASLKLRKRREGQSEEVVRYADRAMRRLTKKFQRLTLRGKSGQVTVTAVSRELAGFVWGLMVGRTEDRQQAA